MSRMFVASRTVEGAHSPPEARSHPDPLRLKLTGQGGSGSVDTATVPTIKGLA